MYVLVMTVMMAVTMMALITRPSQINGTNDLYYTNPVVRRYQYSTADGVTDSPCISEPDEVYGGILLNCSGKRIKEFNSNWIPALTNVTTINLGNNELDYLQNSSFANAPSLKYLRLEKNRFTYIKSDWFRGIKTLQVLDLSENTIDLDKSNFENGVIFRHVSSMTRLYLNDNGNVQRPGEYPEQLLKDLHRLTELGLDTFAQGLEFGPIFDNLTSLKWLKLTGGTRSIKNCSFSAFVGIPLQTLVLQNLPLLHNTDSDAYSPLESISNLFFYEISQKLNDTFLSLKPFVGRNFTNLFLELVGGFVHDAATFEGTKVMNKAVGKYVREMCIKHLSVYSCHALVLGHAFFGHSILSRCLKTIDLTKNPVFEIPGIFQLFMFPQLVSVAVSHSDVHPRKIPSCIQNSPSGSSRLGCDLKLRYHNGDHKMDERNTIIHPDNELRNTNCTNRLQSGENNLVRSENKFNCSEILLSIALTSGQGYKFCASLPFSLSRLYIVDISRNMLPLDFVIVFRPNTLKEAYISNNGIHKMTGEVRGLDKLEILDVSQNDGKYLNPIFFDFFPSLRVLFLIEMNLNILFVESSSSRLFQNLTSLEIIDISNNGLWILSDDTFKTTKLRILILFKNRFRFIPVSLQNVPNLCALDLSYNSITELTPQEMSQLDQQVAKRGNFSLKLEGNLLSCTCSNFQFLYWLQRTSVTLDLNGNYSCLTESGDLSYTGEFRDLASFWRQCQGHLALLISIIIFSFLCFCFMTTLFLFHFQSRIEAYVHQVILKRIKPKNPSDYNIGVCIEYSDEDATFACLPLREFIEEELGLSTYVRHRDLLANNYRDTSISRAIENSWRVLLVVTHSYLNSDRWSFYTMKLASSSITLTNQGKIALLVDELVGKKVPLYVLGAAQEDNVIPFEVAPSGEVTTLCCETKTRLIKSLRYDSFNG